MPVSSVWTNPSAAGTLDLATGAVLTETWVDAIASNFLYLGGTLGKITQYSNYQANNASTTTSSGPVALTGATVPAMTTLAGSLVLVFWSFAASINAAGQTAAFYIQQDAVGYSEVGAFVSSASGAVEMVSGFWPFPAVTAASHTYNLGWGVTAANTLSMYSPVITNLIAIEIRR